jgi:hypothetical protein
VLDVRQQAKFRVFEENMERRKLELVTRARQGESQTAAAEARNKPACPAEARIIQRAKEEDGSKIQR